MEGQEGENEWISYEKNISHITGVGFLPSNRMNIPKSNFYINVSTLPQAKELPIDHHAS